MFRRFPILRYAWLKRAGGAGWDYENVSTNACGLEGKVLFMDCAWSIRAGNPTGFHQGKRPTGRSINRIEFQPNTCEKKKHPTKRNKIRPFNFEMKLLPPELVPVVSSIAENFIFVICSLPNLSRSRVLSAGKDAIAHPHCERRLCDRSATTHSLSLSLNRKMKLDFICFGFSLWLLEEAVFVVYHSPCVCSLRPITSYAQLFSRLGSGFVHLISIFASLRASSRNKCRRRLFGASWARWPKACIDICSTSVGGSTHTELQSTLLRAPVTTERPLCCWH